MSSSCNIIILKSCKILRGFKYAPYDALCPSHNSRASTPDLKQALHRHGICPSGDLTLQQMWQRKGKANDLEKAARLALREGQPHKKILEMLRESRQYQSCYAQYGPENAQKLAELALTAAIRKSGQGQGLGQQLTPPPPEPKPEQKRGWGIGR